MHFAPLAHVSTRALVSLRRPISIAAASLTLALVPTAFGDTPNDPYFANQWHLQNTGQGGGTPGADINVAPWWNFAGGVRLGAGVNIAVVDDGVQFTHPDLAANYKPALSYDFNNNDASPLPMDPYASDGYYDDHGTAVAGVAAGVGNNGVGMTGVAPRAGLAAIQLISLEATDAQEADALTYRFNGATAATTNHIYSNSWGPSDVGDTLAGPGVLTKVALANAAKNGRGGKGSIYVWAAGNGGDVDGSNFDGYANNRNVIAVAASTNRGVRASYSERGSNVFVNAPSDGGTLAIYTTDRTGTNNGYNWNSLASSNANYDGDPFSNLDYTSTFGGTSSATPVVSGVVALMLEANPNLTARDVKQILARTSTKIDPTNGSWKTNAAGLSHSELYGFGRVNATAAATMAQSWTGVGPEISATTASLRTAALAIPDGTGTLASPAGGTTASDSILVTAALVLETIEVNVDVTHARRGSLQVLLTSPGGVVSTLASLRSKDAGANYAWTFTTVRDWGELSTGLWTLSLRDFVAGNVGTLNSWSLTMYGTAVPEPTVIIVLAGFGLFVRRRRGVAGRD